MADPFDKLESSKQSVGGGDYAPWWSEDKFEINEGDELVGIVVEKHAYTDPGGDEHPVATVRSLERGWGEEGQEVSTPTRKGIEPFAEQANIGDLVLIEYTGSVKANSGRDMHTYEASRLSEDEWSEMDNADEIRAVWEASQHFVGGTAQSTAPPKTDDGGSSGVPQKAIDYAEDVVDIQGGEVELDELDEYLNEVRDYDVDPEEVVEASDALELDGSTVGKKD